jgi:hypothetical protein
MCLVDRSAGSVTAGGWVDSHCVLALLRDGEWYGFELVCELSESALAGHLRRDDLPPAHRAAQGPAGHHHLARVGIRTAAALLPTHRIRPLRAGHVALLALIGWLIGPVLVFISRVWTRRDKIIGAILLFLPIAVLSLGLIAAGPSGSEESTRPGDTHPVGEKVEAPAEPGPVELVLLVAGLPSALYLGCRTSAYG